ncbi:MAG: hypothetical protein WC777_02535 [Candidatus Gracilibacteria bacterium]|jgi:hypothetical protein
MNTLVFLGALVSVCATLAYTRDMLHGKTQPNRVSWIMWAIGPLIGTAAGLANGVGLAVLPVFMAGFTCILVLLVSFTSKQASWKLSSFDYACGALSVLALLLWAITDQPAVAIVFAMISDSMAYIPTIIKAWKNPESESGLTYAAGTFSALTAFTVMELWTFSELAFPIYLIVANSILIFFIWRKKFLTLQV